MPVGRVVPVPVWTLSPAPHVLGEAADGRPSVPLDARDHFLRGLINNQVAGRGHLPPHQPSGRSLLSGTLSVLQLSLCALHPGQHGHRGGSGAHHAALEIDALETQARKQREGSSHQLTLNAGWLAHFILPEAAWRSPELLPTGLQQLSQMGGAVCSGLSEALGPLVPAAGTAPGPPGARAPPDLLRHQCLPSAGSPQGISTWSELKPLPGCASLKGTGQLRSAVRDPRGTKPH